ncbi:MAG: hypothetical protein OER86_14070, partial [Phycisphaerae bacterium]|nr:hypothetical protein [Phycisphaerae bacterium]
MRLSKILMVLAVAAAISTTGASAQAALIGLSTGLLPDLMASNVTASYDGSTLSISGDTVSIESDGLAGPDEFLFGGTLDITVTDPF